MKLFEEVNNDLSVLNLILYKLQPDLGLESEGDSELREISESDDIEIKHLADRIETNLGTISAVLRTETQITPYNKEDTDRVIIRIMFKYMSFSTNIKLDSFIGENNSAEINRIHSAFSEFSASINDYNGLARNKNWPEIISINEAFIIVNRLFQSVTL